jgi:hypothetical protein
MRLVMSIPMIDIFKGVPYILFLELSFILRDTKMGV